MNLISTTKTEYLTFKRYKKPKKKTYDVSVFDKQNIIIGNIYWKPGWHRYVIEFLYAVFDTKCLSDIIEYIEKLEKEKGWWYMFVKNYVINYNYTNQKGDKLYGKNNNI